MLAKNSLEGKAEAFLGRIETLLDEIDAERNAAQTRCKEISEDITSIYEEAKGAGVPAKALKGIVKHRQLGKKQQAISAKLDPDEAAAYATLVMALGELGAAAAKRAGYEPQQSATN